MYNNLPYDLALKQPISYLYPSNSLQMVPTIHNITLFHRI